jgi:hypothetical protein
VEEPDVYYSVYWSRLRGVDRHEIHAAVPSVAGVYELYYEDEKGKLVLFRVAKSWFSGVRVALREETDLEIVRDELQRRILDERRCLYRYCEMRTEPDMLDVLYFLERTYIVDSTEYHHSGRYDKIYVNELSDDKVVMV